MPLTQMWRAFLALLFIFIWASPFASAQSVQPVPPLTARLIDQAGILSAGQAQAIENRLRGIEDASGSQVVVLIVPSTAPEDIAPYANRVASDWKIGRKNVGDGLLIVVAPDDRRMRIEVARALEGAIPDLVASRIIDQQMAPHFRNNDYAGGILAALDQIGARIAGEALPPPTTRASPSSSSSSRSWSDTFSGFSSFLSLAGLLLVCAFLRKLLGALRAALLLACIAAAVTWWFSGSAINALIAAVLAFMFTLFSGGGGGSSGGSGSSSSSGWSSSSSSSSSGFSSGGGGSFGGGGASGRW